MPVCPVNAIRLDMKVHGIYTYISITLEDLLIAPVWYGRVQAADFIVVGNVQNLSWS